MWSDSLKSHKAHICCSSQFCNILPYISIHLRNSSRFLVEFIEEYTFKSRTGVPPNVTLRTSIVLQSHCLILIVGFIDCYQMNVSAPNSQPIDRTLIKYFYLRRFKFEIAVSRVCSIVWSSTRIVTLAEVMIIIKTTLFKTLKLLRSDWEFGKAINLYRVKFPLKRNCHYQSNCAKLNVPYTAKIN